MTQITCMPADYDCIGVGLNVMIWIEFEFILTLCTRISDSWDPVSDQNRPFYVYHSDAIVVNQYEIDFDFGSVGLRPMRNFRQTHICLTRRTGLASVTWIRDDDVSKPACCVTPVIKPHDDSTCEFSSNSASRIYTLELDLNQLKFWIHDTRFCEYHQKQSYLILFNFQGIFFTGEVAVWIEGTHLSYSFVLVVTRETSIKFDGVTFVSAALDSARKTYLHRPRTGVTSFLH